MGHWEPHSCKGDTRSQGVDTIKLAHISGLLSNYHTTHMATQAERASESALEDLLGISTEASTDMDEDFDVQAEPASESDSSSSQPTQQPSPRQQQARIDDGAPGSSRGITRTRRPITSELTHLTYLNTPGLSQQQRNHIRRLREQERNRRTEDRQSRLQERRNQRAAQT